MEYADRIAEILKRLDTNQAGLAKKLGVSRGIVSEFASGSREPSKDFIIGLSKLGISIDWFLSGQGEVFQSYAREAKWATVAHLNGITPPGADGECKLDTVTNQPDDRDPRGESLPESVLLSGAKMVGRRAVEIEVERADPDIAFVDLYAQAVAAGPGKEAEAYLEAIRMPVMRRFLQPWRPEQIRALEARGDSMTKIGLFDRDIILFVPEEKEGDGIFVISIDNRMQVKRLEFDILGHTLRIISENDRYAPRILEDKGDIERVTIEGKVVGWLHRHPY